MALFQIPFANIPQKFSIELAGTTYFFVNRWNPAHEGGWFLDIYDSEEKPMLMNLALVTGSDLFSQHKHLGFPGTLVVYTEGDEGVLPTLENLGTDSNVWLIT
jgi:hypothetical protein